MKKNRSKSLDRIENHGNVELRYKDGSLDEVLIAHPDTR